MLTAPKTERTFEGVPAGTHLATCYQLIHIGTINEPYQGQPREISKIRLTFEFPHETRTFKEGESEKPLVLSEEYTLSMGERANLRKFINGMLGKNMSDEEAYAFDVESLVGKSCLLTVIEKPNSKGVAYPRITTAAPLMKGMEKPEQANPSAILTYQKWDNAFFDRLPEFIRKKMEGSREFEEMMTRPEEEVHPADKIPF